MSTGKSILVIASAGVGIAALMVVIWPTEPRVSSSTPRAAAVEDIDSAYIPVEPVPLAEGRESVSIQDPGPASTAIAGQETQTSDSVFIKPGDGSLNAVMRMLEDPAFADACAKPSDADAEVLNYLVVRARNTLNAYKTEECARRVDAGLYERLPGFRPGEPFTVPAPGHDNLQSLYVDGGEARLVVFPIKEYPEMYTLRDQVDLIDAELRLRNKRASR